MSEWISSIRNCFQSERVLYSRHARQEMLHESFGRIAEHEVCEAVLNGEIIEEYANDRPYASRLIFGVTGAGRPLHVL